MNSDVEKELIDKIFLTNWKDYDGPDYYSHKDVPIALLNLITLEQKAGKWSVYNQVLSAIGNNHAGTFYPAILEALPFIIQIASITQNELVKNCSLEIMTDLYCSFNAETGSFSDINDFQLEIFVRENIRNALAYLETTDSGRNEELIVKLRDYINEEIIE